MRHSESALSGYFLISHRVPNAKGFPVQAQEAFCVGTKSLINHIVDEFVDVLGLVCHKLKLLDHTI